MGLNKKVKQWPKGNLGRKIEKAEGHYVSFAPASLVFQWLLWQTAHKTSVMARWFPANWTLALWALSREYVYHFSTAVLHGFYSSAEIGWKSLRICELLLAALMHLIPFFQALKLTWVSILGNGHSYLLLSKRKQIWESQAPLSELAMAGWESQPAQVLGCSHWCHPLCVPPTSTCDYTMRSDQGTPSLHTVLPHYWPRAALPGLSSKETTHPIAHADI